MGGIAFKAPVLATVFLIVTFANLAMPGSSNFIGEFMILLGAFSTHIWIAAVASLGVVGAGYYALRLFIGAMHNRVGPRVKSFEIDPIESIALVPLVGIILVLAFYPQFGLSKSETSLKAAIAPAAQFANPTAVANAARTSAPRSSVAYSPTTTTNR